MRFCNVQFKTKRFCLNMCWCVFESSLPFCGQSFLQTHAFLKTRHAEIKRRCALTLTAVPGTISSFYLRGPVNSIRFSRLFTRIKISWPTCATVSRSSDHDDRSEFSLSGSFTSRSNGFLSRPIRILCRTVLGTFTGFSIYLAMGIVFSELWLTKDTGWLRQIRFSTPTTLVYGS